MTQQPSIGRIVHYTRLGTGINGQPGNYEGETVPAIITALFEDGAVALKIFYYYVEDPWHTDAYPYSETPKPGHWTWPPRT